MINNKCFGSNDDWNKRFFILYKNRLKKTSHYYIFTLFNSHLAMEEASTAITCVF